MEMPSRSGKALSVIAAVMILLVIVVTASIGVSVWMGGLTAMATEEVTFSDVVWGKDNANVSVTLQNTGTADLYIKEFKIAGVNPKSISPVLDTPYLLKRGNSVTFVVSKAGGFDHKTPYMFTVTTGKGNNFGPDCSTAP